MEELLQVIIGAIVLAVGDVVVRRIRDMKIVRRSRALQLVTDIAVRSIAHAEVMKRQYRGRTIPVKNPKTDITEQRKVTPEKANAIAREFAADAFEKMVASDAAAELLKKADLVMRKNNIPQILEVVYQAGKRINMNAYDVVRAEIETESAAEKAEKKK